jgi:MFS family permease
MKSNAYALPVMMAIIIVQQIDRNIVNVLLEPLKAEFSLTDGQVGLLAGTAFAVTYMIAGLPLALFADRTNRRNLLAALVAVWSALTALCGLAQNMTTLVIARLGVGAAEAGALPISLSILSDVTAERKRGAIAGMIYASAGIGTFLSFLVGGYLAAEHGWRAAFLFAGLPGVALAAMVLALVREPARATPAKKLTGGSGNIAVDIGGLLFHPVLGWVYWGATLYTMCASGVGAWAVSVLVRMHGFDLKSAGLAVACASGLCGCLGTALAGRLSDAASARQAGGALRVAAFAAVFYLCAALAFANAASPAAALVALCCVGFSSQAYTGPVNGVISRIAPQENRTLGFALYSVFGSVLGVAIGPGLIGILSDRLGGGHSLAHAIVFVVPALILPALMFSIAGARMDRRMAQTPAAA